MKLLKQLLFELEYDKIIGDVDVKIQSIHFNSQEVVKSSLFVANKGVKNDGHDYIMAAISAGASVVVCEKLPLNIVPEITYVKVSDSSYALAIIASNFFGNPSRKIKLVGVTGTNGKTSTVYYLTSLFEKLYFPDRSYPENYLGLVGMISTIENQVNNKRFPSTHTTPDAITINQLLSDMVDTGCEYCFMEVSSHAISQKRISGLDFDIAVFTNISRDHLDYHGTFENYLNTKKSFFDQLSPKAKAIVNIDDPDGCEIARDSQAQNITYGQRLASLYYGTIIRSSVDGLCIGFDGLWEDKGGLEEITMNTDLVGDFNLYNLLATFAVACELGIHEKNRLASPVTRHSILEALGTVPQVPGRFNVLKGKDGVFGIVDYAHTPDALSKVITSIGKFCDVEKDLVIVVGCGGNRDAGKRSIMAKIAAENSRLSIFTSDNPRFENPESILDDMCSDLGSDLAQKIKRITNREDAIRMAVESASKGEIILIAGKGHENYQEIQSVRHPFDDFKTLKKILKI
jgi:UDP-N-acetylmuramoyl-L-alanyl-D-glutamate--2,6-diaminopimelate ligase